MQTIARVSLIAGREVRQQMRSPWLLWIVALVTLAAPLSVYVGVLDFVRRQGDYVAFERRLTEQRAGNELISGTQLEPTLRIIRPPSSGSIFVRGLDEVAAQQWDVTPAGLRTASAPRAATSVYDAGTTFDLEFLLRTTLGLMAINLATWSISKDKQGGTLKFLLSIPVPAHTIVVGRLVGSAITLSAIVAATVGLGIATVVVAAPDLANFQAVLTALMLAGATFLYLCVLYSIGLLIGGWAGRPGTANVAATIVWLVITLISVPAVAFVGRAVFSPPAATLVEWKQDEEYRRMLQAAQDSAGNTVRSRVGATAELRAVQFEGALRSELEEQWDQALVRIRETLNDLERDRRVAAESEARLIQRLAGLSPGALFLTAASDLAGTGNASMRRWRRLAEEHQANTERALFDRPPRIYLRVPSSRGISLMFFERRPLPRWSELPAVAPAVVSARTQLADAASSLSLLICTWVVAAVAALFSAYRGQRC